MIVTDIVSMIFRLAELAFATIVAGITGHYLHVVRGASSWSLGRFIYTEVVAGLSILLALLWLLPFAGSFIHWPIDILLSIMWFIAFGLIVNWFYGVSCSYFWHWSAFRFRGPAGSCGSWRTDTAFAFLSAICWLLSALLGIYWTRRKRNQAVATGPPDGPTGRRKWYRRSRV
ncbi:hypothetical protein BD289DRAFT_365135 [Coniella lustricola]|uniref:MARVEL domain-containing protein n=1 Tax=Coniella lustricola TaxID=2025994 RepID=A0A2T3ACT8_9PEZI|nr:hypothetical protein BD289DRAFT_365135 [Coniella lustricola]